MTMKLSQAILLGSIGTEQGFGAIAAYPAPGRAMCAIGAALTSIGKQFDGTENGEAFRALRETWPWSDVVVRCPVKIVDIDTDYYDCAWSIIWRLNDHAKWTRPQIAAWVATLEAQFEPRAQDQAPAQTQETVHVPEPESVNII